MHDLHILTFLPSVGSTGFGTGLGCGTKAAALALDLSARCTASVGGTSSSLGAGNDKRNLVGFLGVGLGLLARLPR